MSNQPSASLQPITVIGSDSPGGSYLLRIQLTRSITIRFGKFKGGKRIHLPAGNYIYTGSARANGKSPALARRILRHATRSSRNWNHSIRRILIRQLGDLIPKGEKRLHWNIDHLLDRREAHLTHVIAIRTCRNLENELAAFIENDPDTMIIERGLGANDIPGNTHLLRVTASESWWISIITLISERFEF